MSEGGGECAQGVAISAVYGVVRILIGERSPGHLVECRGAVDVGKLPKYAVDRHGKYGERLDRRKRTIRCDAL